MTTAKFAWTFVLTGALLTAACGDSKTSMLPTAPSAVGAAVQAEETGDAVSGTMAQGGNGNGRGNNGGGNGNGNGNGNNGGGNGNGNGNQPNVPPTVQPPTNTSPTTTRKVEIQGPITAKSGDSITVRGQQVTVASTCVIRHGQTQYTFADLQVGDLVHVRAMRTTTGTGAAATSTLEAEQIMLQNPGFGGGDGEGEDPTNLVSVSASDSLASEAGGDNGTFRLTRAGTATLLAAPLTVTFTLAGTATNGTDYTSVPLTATFLANQPTVDVTIAPTPDATTEGVESVILTLTSVGPYELGSPASATLNITDTTNPLVSVTAFDSTASETGPDLGAFRFARTGSTAAALTVTFTIAGTATNGTDYQSIPLTVTFGVGQATADVYVVPLSPDAVEGSETVEVTVTDGAAYDVVSPSVATVTIAG